jgi:hypothetical protein
MDFRDDCQQAGVGNAYDRIRGGGKPLARLPEVAERPLARPPLLQGGQPTPGAVAPK